jgi:hypothetical protein
MRLIGLLLAIFALACEGPEQAPGSVSHAANQPIDRKPSANVSRGIALAHRFRQVHGRLAEPMPKPEKFAAKSCENARIRQRAARAEARVLTLSFEDERYGARSLMPLSMTRWLRSQHEQRIGKLLAPPGRPDAPVFEFRSEDDAGNTEELLSVLDERTFKGVFFVVQYKKPHLIRKKGKLRREWLPGLLQAWFTIFDIDESEALCSARLFVVSNVEDEPVWLRTKATVQSKLLSELGKAMLTEAERALPTLSSELTIERPPDAQRLAAAVPERR